MAATFLVDGTNVTVDFAYTSTVDKAIEVVNFMAHELFDRGMGDHGTEDDPILFDDLNNQNKLDLIDDYLLMVIINMAKQRNADDKMELARIDASDDGIEF